MRSQLLFIASVVTLIAACSDRQQPTSPIERGSNVGATPTSSLSATSATPAAKPAAQVGFTQVVRVESPITTLTAPGDGAAIAYCPAGSLTVGGGHYLTGLALTNAPPLVSISEPIPGSNPGWGIQVLNHAPGAMPVTVRAYALCVS